MRRFASWSTEQVASQRQEARTVPSITEPTLRVQQALGVTSKVTFGMGLMVGAILVASLLPFVVYSKLKNDETKDSSSSNVSSTSGSRTAVLALWGRSQAYLQKSGGPDHLAPRLLEQSELVDPAVVPPWLQHALLDTCGWLSRTNFWLTRHCFEDQAAYIATLFHTGLVSPLQVRTCWLDDCVEAFVQNLDKNTDPLTENNPRANVVILGAGFDTRSYRLQLRERRIQTYEVDAPGTQKEKKHALQKANIDVQETKFCPCDFETQEWLECLDRVGFNRRLPTLFLWEGVTMYLSKSTVIETLTTIGSQNNWFVAFDYINSDWAESAIWKSAMSRVGEPFKFAMAQKEPQELVKSCGLQVLEHLYDQGELASQYLPKHFNGEPMGILGNYGGFVLAGTKQ